MAEVFISYKREEREAVERIAQALRALDLSIWFDASMSAGETFSDEIDREARAAKAILVCWSPTARDSRWVKAEAMIGFESDKLAACYVAGPDGFSPPTPFNTSHAEDLRAWLAAPSNTHSGWKSVLRRIGRLCERADIETWGALDTQATASELRNWIAAHNASPLFMAVEALLREREEQDAERLKLEQATRERRAREDAERQVREAAEQMAREAAERASREGEERSVIRKYKTPDKSLGDKVRSIPLSGLVLAIGLVVLYLVTPPGTKEMVLGAILGVGRAELQGAGTTVCAAAAPNAEACYFSRAILGSAEDVWTAQFQQGRLPNYDAQPGAYRHPTLVVFQDAVATGCGNASSDVGPFYCPADGNLYIDPSFYRVMEERLRAPGDFAQAYVIAHEVGHHVQNLIGANRMQIPGENQNQTSVRIELQADCLAGVWGHTAQASLAIDEADLREALNAAHSIGDDTLGARETQYTHGTSAQRMTWFRRGFDSGDARQCDTFAVRNYNQL